MTVKKALADETRKRLEWEGVPTHIIAADKSFIRCKCCGLYSANPQDISNLWCGYCNRYHTYRPEDEPIQEGNDRGNQMSESVTQIVASRKRKELESKGEKTYTLFPMRIDGKITDCISCKCCGYSSSHENHVTNLWCPHCGAGHYPHEESDHPVLWWARAMYKALHKFVQSTNVRESADILATMEDLYNRTPEMVTNEDYVKDLSIALYRHKIRDIDVKDELPPEGSVVLLLLANGSTIIGKTRMGGKFSDDAGDMIDWSPVTHWKPIHWEAAHANER